MLAPVFAICYTLDSRYVRPTLVLVVRLRELCGLNFLDRSIADLALNSRESKLDIPASIPPAGALVISSKNADRRETKLL